MRRTTLFLMLLLIVSPMRAAEMPEGVYEPYFTGWDGLLHYWLAGDIVILDGNLYSFQGERGRYDVAASGRVTFSGGALDGAYAEMRQSGGAPVLVLPVKENLELGKELAASDIWAYRRD